jgi:hypothetical protein
MRLFGSLSAAEFVEKRGIAEVAGLARAELAGESVWTVVETRRVYRAASIKDPATGKSRRGSDGRTVKDPARKGDTWRSIRRHTVTSTRDDGLAVLSWLADAHDTVVWTGPDGVSRVDVRALPDRPREWPLTTHEYALMPGTIWVKQHAGFDREWDAARGREAVRGGGVTPLPLPCDPSTRDPQSRAEAARCSIRTVDIREPARLNSLVHSGPDRSQSWVGFPTTAPKVKPIERTSSASCSATQARSYKPQRWGP